MARREHGSGSIFKQSGRWVGQINMAPPGAKRRRKSVYGDTRAEVVRKLAQAAAARDRGEPGTAAPTFATWFDQWVESAPKLAPRTRQSYRSLANAYLKPALGNVRIDRMTPDHVHYLHRQMEGLAPNTIRNAHRVAGRALKIAQAEGRITSNPFHVVEVEQGNIKGRHALSPDAVEAIFDHIAGTDDESRWQDALMLGARKGESLGLTWENVDFDNGRIVRQWQLQPVPYLHGCKTPAGHKAHHCPRRKLDLRRDFEYVPVEGNLVLQRPKRGSVRVHPIPLRMIGPLRLLHHQYLMERGGTGYHDHGLVWHRGNGRPIRDDLQDWYALLDEVGIPRVDLHSARHTAATALLRSQTDPKIIQEILGHSIIATTQLYQHVDVGMKRSAIDAAFGGPSAERPALP